MCIEWTKEAFYECPIELYVTVRRMSAPKCVKCSGIFCEKEEFDRNRLPDFCPMKEMESVIEAALEKYHYDEVKSIYVPAALTEKESYEVVRGRRIPVRPRIRELVDFAKKVKAEKIGMAFCAGLSDEASRVASVLENFGFSTYSVRCSCGGIDKTRLGVPKEYKIGEPEKYEAGCNPLVQAALLNAVETDLNVIVGLCIGHDALFTRHSRALVTTLIVKDRYTGHNPVIALYSSYHKRSFLR